MAVLLVGVDPGEEAWMRMLTAGLCTEVGGGADHLGSPNQGNGEAGLILCRFTVKPRHEGHSHFSIGLALRLCKEKETMRLMAKTLLMSKIHSCAMISATVYTVPGESYLNKDPTESR